MTHNYISQDLVDHYEYEDQIEAAAKADVQKNNKNCKNYISQELADYYEYEDQIEAAAEAELLMHRHSSNHFEQVGIENTEIPYNDALFIRNSQHSLHRKEDELSGMLVRGGLMAAGSFLLMGAAGPAALAVIGLGAWNERTKRKIDERHNNI